MSIIIPKQHKHAIIPHLHRIVRKPVLSCHVGVGRDHSEGVLISASVIQPVVILPLPLEGLDYLHALRGRGEQHHVIHVLAGQRHALEVSDLDVGTQAVGGQPVGHGAVLVIHVESPQIARVGAVGEEPQGPEDGDEAPDVHTFTYWKVQKPDERERALGPIHKAEDDVGVPGVAPVVDALVGAGEVDLP